MSASPSYRERSTGHPPPVAKLIIKNNGCFLERQRRVPAYLDVIAIIDSVGRNLAPVSGNASNQVEGMPAFLMRMGFFVALKAFVSIALPARPGSSNVE